MEKLAAILERFMHPLLYWFDRTGVLGGFRFGPLSRMIAAIAAVIIVAYIGELLSRPLSRDVSRLRKVRFAGRVVTFCIAMMMTSNILREADFIAGRGGLASRSLGANFAYFLILCLVLFLEIRLFRKK